MAAPTSCWADHLLPGSMDGLRLLERIGELDPTAGRMLISGTNDTRLQVAPRRLGLVALQPGYTQRRGRR